MKAFLLLAAAAVVVPLLVLAAAPAGPPAEEGPAVAAATDPPARPTPADVVANREAPAAPAAADNPAANDTAAADGPGGPLGGTAAVRAQGGAPPAGSKPPSVLWKPQANTSWSQPVTNPIHTGPGTLTTRNPAVGQGDGRFGAPRDGGRTHKGVDIKAPVWTPVHPAGPGKVVAPTGYGGKDTGVRVTVQHPNGSTSKYMHLQPTGIPKVGTTVSPQTPIGYVGRTGNVPKQAEPHVHFEMRNRQGTAVAPNITTPSAPKSTAAPARSGAPDPFQVRPSTSTVNRQPPVPPPGGPGTAPAPVKGVRIGLDVAPESFERVESKLKDTILKE